MSLRIALRVAGLALVHWTSGPALAQLQFTEACVSAPGTGQQRCERNSPAPVVVQGTAIAAEGWEIGSGSARGLSAYGTLKGQTSATALTPPSGTAIATSFTRFLDVVVINSPGLQGTTGFVDIRLDYEWQLTNGLGSNIADLVLEFGPHAARALEQRSRAPNAPDNDVLRPLEVVGDAIPLAAQLGRYFEVRMPFVFGNEIQIVQSLTVSSQASFGATLAVDAFNSAYWGGMVVRDAGGGQVPFLAQSSSGVDYAISYAPVPEPGTLLLWAGGLAFLGTSARSRRADAVAG
jgi:hypothetical protein